MSKLPFSGRRSGVLLHPTSLPQPGGIAGAARHFVDFLADSGFGVWQVLPLGPTHADGSPYLCLSSHAGNPDLIDLRAAAEHLRLDPPNGGRAAVVQALWSAFAERASDSDRQSFARFKADNAHWLDEYALFRALRTEQGETHWCTWPVPLRQRDPQALAAARDRLQSAIERCRFEQFLFDGQWQALRAHAAARDVLLFGDLPIFVDHDSADVWCEQRFFQLDPNGQPTAVAGVPPDYFSETGQRWGNPLYAWEPMQQDGFSWWQERVATQLRHCDLLRIDHFRGFAACWEIPANEPTAVGGHWVKSPGAALLESLQARFPSLPVIAEDLGTITPDVVELQQRFELPGMKVLQFAFDGSASNPYLPHNHLINSVVYTGTHDNDTSCGWFNSLDSGVRQRVLDYLGQPSEHMPWPLVRAALASVAQLAIIPMQDLLGLDSEARMNRPGTVGENWAWRFDWSQVDPGLVSQLRHLNGLYGRR